MKDNHKGVLIHIDDMMRTERKIALKVIAAVGIAGMTGIIVSTIISMGFLAQSGTMPNPVFFQSVILVLNAVIVVGIIVGVARWIYGKL